MLTSEGVGVSISPKSPNQCYKKCMLTSKENLFVHIMACYYRWSNDADEKHLVQSCRAFISK